MVKYELIPEQLLRENTCTPENFFVPGKINVNDILAAHKKTYFDKLDNQEFSKKEVRAIGFQCHIRLIVREKLIAQGTIEGALRIY